MPTLRSALPYRFEHLQRLPSGACVVIANHRSYLDGLVLIAALPPHFSPVIGTVLRRVGARFVGRRSGLSTACATSAPLVIPCQCFQAR